MYIIVFCCFIKYSVLLGVTIIGQTLEVTIFLPYPATRFGVINCELFAKIQPFFCLYTTAGHL